MRSEKREPFNGENNAEKNAAHVAWHVATGGRRLGVLQNK